MNEKNISIITINKDNPIGLARTYQSIKSFFQINESVKWIIVDGNSSTSDMEIIADLKGNPRVTIISENDEGIYNAMNKGWKISLDSHVLFLNSGDFIFPEEFQKLFLNFKDDELCDIFYAKVQLFDKNLLPGKVHGPSAEELKKTTLAHMSAITSRYALKKLNGFDEKYKIAADRDFFIRAQKSGLNFKQFDYIVAGFPQDGVSTHYYNTRLEDLKISKKHGYINFLQYWFKRLQLELKK